MAGVQKDMSGALFKNDRKEKETHPDYRGVCQVEGKDWEIAAWIKKDRNDKPYMSLSFKEPFVKTSAPEAKTTKVPAKVVEDDDIPF
jgi:uncharacterized protein (DUF736 family)